MDMRSPLCSAVGCGGHLSRQEPSAATISLLSSAGGGLFLFSLGREFEGSRPHRSPYFLHRCQVLGQSLRLIW